MLTGSQVLSVKELTQYLRALLESDPVLSSVIVRGEVSNYKHHVSSGHHYFTLKDESASIRCVLFKSRGQKLAFLPSNGMRVLAFGYVSVFDRDGQYQLYVDHMEPDGIGALYVKFEQLKKKLEAEGLFDNKRKRPLPWLPRKVGVITSLNGAAIKDIISVSRRRFPGAHLVLKDALVQGESAPSDICRAISSMNSVDGVEVIILGRGGGSLEELWAFNTEEVARAIFASRVPVVSAVGHETDYTIADFVADVRAPTPSAAAEIVFPDRAKLVGDILSLRQRMLASEDKICSNLRNRLCGLMNRWPFSHPEQLLAYRRQALDQASKALFDSARLVVERRKAVLDGLVGRLSALDPFSVLKRGYSICRRIPEMTIVSSSGQVKRGDGIDIRLMDGNISCTVNDSPGKAPARSQSRDSEMGDSNGA